MKSLPKTLLLFLVFLSIVSLTAYSPGYVLAQEEDFSEDEEEELIQDEEEGEEEEEADPTPVPSPTTALEEETGEVLAGATELGETGAEHVVYILAGFVGLLAVAAGFKIAHSDVEE